MPMFITIMAFLTLSSCIGGAFLLYKMVLHGYSQEKLSTWSPLLNKSLFNKDPQNITYEQ